MASPSTARADTSAAAGPSPLGWMRFGARLTGLVLVLLAYLSLHGLWRLVRARSPWPPRFLGMAARVIGVRARVSGRPLRRDVFFVSNHLSWLDILVLGGATGSAFISKAEVARVPLVGWLASLNRTIFVDRDDRRSMPQQIAIIRDAISQGPVTIFPEGTTSDGRIIMPFKAGLLQVLDPPVPGMRVQPLFLDYGPAAADIAWGDPDEGGQTNALRLLCRAGTIPCTVHALEPFDPAPFGGRKGVSAEARRRIGEAVAASSSRVTLL